MEGFTLSLALVDSIPVLFFGASMIMVAARFNNPLFIIGAVLSTLAGCLKVLWKLILGIWKKDVRWLNKPFVPMQVSGFMLMLISFVIGFGKINWRDLLSTVTGFPSIFFFALWIAMMGTMGWYRKNKFDNSAKANWTAQLINCVGQGALFLAILFAK